MVRSVIKITQRFTTSQQWAAFIALAILVTGLSFSYLVTGQIRQQLLTQQQALATNLVRDASILLRTSLSKDDRISANIILQDWVDQELLLSATLYNSTQQPIAEQGLLELSDYHVFWLNQPVTDDNQLIGHLRVAINMSKAYDISRHNAVLLMLSSILLSLIIGGLSYLWGERSLIARKQQLKALADLSADAKPDLIKDDAYNINDVELTQSINKLVQRNLHQRDVQQALDAFTSDLTAPAGASLKHHNSALLFIEVDGYDELKKSISASELAQLLSRYQRLLSKAAKLYSGTIDRYSDNGILMVFGYPENDSKDASHCLYAAQLFLGLVEVLQKKDILLQSLSFKLAAHQGSILIAPTATPFKQEKRLTFTGDTVYWSAQLAQSSKEDAVLVSQNLADQLGSTEQIKWRSGPKVLDLNSHEQDSHWLNALPDSAEKLIARQVKHIVSLSEFSDD